LSDKKVKKSKLPAKTTSYAKFKGKKKMIVDPETGEKEDVYTISEKSTMDNYFTKVWLTNILQALDMIGNKKIDVVNYILENRNESNNRLVATQKEIAEAVGCTRQTVSKVIVALRNSDFVRTKPGIVYINPNMAFRGGHKKRMYILHEYEQIEPDWDEEESGWGEEPESKEKSDKPKDSSSPKN